MRQIDHADFDFGIPADDHAIIEGSGGGIADPQIGDDGATPRILRASTDRLQRQAPDPLAPSVLGHDQIGQPESLLPCVRFEAAAIDCKTQ
nr:hypothetical protein [Maritimibacter sp. 55A14]